MLPATNEIGSSVPDHQTLMDGLKAILNGKDAGQREILLLDREPNDYASGSASEIVTCRLPDTTELQLFLKYTTGDFESPDGRLNTHRRSDVAYEAMIYQMILHPLETSTPKFYGTFTEGGIGRKWLAIEYLREGMLLDEMASSESLRPMWKAWSQTNSMWDHWEEWELKVMGMAALWLGQFHAAAEARLTSGLGDSLKQYDLEYYSEHARRSLLFGNRSSQKMDWLAAIYERFAKSVLPLLNNRRTISHGDYYSHNIFFHNERICPIDWEHAGIDLGEMDLACLTEGWSDRITRFCEVEYQRGRWPEGAPEDFEQMLCAARLCLCFYNLGTQPDWPNRPDCETYADDLRTVSERMGLM
jgi:aminoglycoside phosphotransferase (APT) family kinase protein